MSTEPTTIHLPRRGRPPGKSGRDLLAVARELLCERGLGGTSMEAVAAAARISKQTLYAQYPSKSDLYTAVVEDWVEQGRTALAPSVEALVRAEDLRSGLDQWAKALQSGLLSAPVHRMRTLVAANATTHPKVAETYARTSWAANMALLADALATLAAGHRLRIVDPAIAADQLVWLILGAPLNQATILGTHRHGFNGDRLTRIRNEGIDTFLARYARTQPKHTRARAEG